MFFKWSIYKIHKRGVDQASAFFSMRFYAVIEFFLIFTKISEEWKYICVNFAICWEMWPFLLYLLEPHITDLFRLQKDHHPFTYFIALWRPILPWKKLKTVVSNISYDPCTTLMKPYKYIISYMCLWKIIELKILYWEYFFFIHISIPW